MKERSGKISKLLKSRDSRESYIRSKLNILIPSQIRGLRLKRQFTQKELGDRAGMRQARISAIESPGEVKFNVETLIRIAAALKVGVSLQFVTFSEMLQWENSYSQDDFNVESLEEDEDFLTPKSTGLGNDSANDSEIEDLLPVKISEIFSRPLGDQKGYKDSASMATIDRGQANYDPEKQVVNL